MITFKSRNVEGEVKDWKFDCAEDLIDEWNGECDLPSNDDTVWAIDIDGKRVLDSDEQLERMGTDEVWFEDLLTYLGVDIW